MLTVSGRELSKLRGMLLPNSWKNVADKYEGASEVSLLDLIKEDDGVCLTLYIMQHEEGFRDVNASTAIFIAEKALMFMQDDKIKEAAEKCIEGIKSFAAKEISEEDLCDLQIILRDAIKGKNRFVEIRGLYQHQGSLEKWANLAAIIVICCDKKFSRNHEAWRFVQYSGVPILGEIRKKLEEVVS